MNLKNLQCPRAAKLFFISVALLSKSTTGYSQTSIAVAPNKMNVLYIGVDNPVSVATSAGSDEKVTVTIQGGEGSASKIGTGLYNVRVATVTDECMVNVFVDEKLAGTIPFRVRNLPAPTGTIGGYKSTGNITAAVFQTQPGLGTYLKDFPFEVHYEILGFTFNIEDDKGDVKSADCQGALFSSEVKELIERYAKNGRTVTIDAIRAKDPGGRVLKLPALVYYIK